MHVDDEEYKKFCASRARLAFVSGQLFATLASTKKILCVPGQINEDLKSELVDTITNALDEVAEILEAEFYPEFKKPLKPKPLIVPRVDPETSKPIDPL